MEGDRSGQVAEVRGSSPEELESDPLERGYTGGNKSLDGGDLGCQTLATRKEFIMS